MNESVQPGQEILSPALTKAVQEAWSDVVSHVQRNYLDLTGRQACAIADYAVGRLVSVVRAATLEDFASNMHASSVPPEIAEVMAESARDAATRAMTEEIDGVN